MNFKTMLKQCLWSVLGVLTLFLTYVFVIFSSHSLLSSILSFALNSVIAGLIIFYAYRSENLPSYWGIIATSMMIWTGSDAIWLICEINGCELQNELSFTQIIYFLPTVFLLFSALSMFKYSLQTNLSAQNLVDTAMILLIYVSFIYFVIFDQVWHDVFSPKNVLNIIYVLIDVCIFCIIFCIYFSVSGLKRSQSFGFCIVGLWLFSAYDAYYSVLTINGVNLKHTIFDLLYEMPFLLFLLGSFHLKNEPKPKFKERKDFNAILIDKFIVLIVLIATMSLFSNDFDIIWLTFIMILLLFYGVLTHQVSSIKNSQILIQKEQNMRERLNKYITQRVNELNAANKRLVELGQYDYLTKTLNRPLFISYLEEIIKSKPLNYTISLFSIDLNHFKTINDSYGHHVGDEVLAQVAKSIKAILPKGAMIARFGGDDFMVVAKHRAGSSYRDILNSLIGAIKQPIFVGEYKITLGANIGIAQTLTSEIVPSDLITQADAALSLSKSRNDIDGALFYDDIKGIVQERSYIEILLNSIEFDKEFRLVFQPQYQIKDKKLIGAEALLRWHSPIKGIVSPAVFIPIAEQSALIVDIGKWVTKHAMEQMSEWNAKYNRSLKIGINVSPKQIDSANFAKNIIAIADSQNLAANCVDMEITEMSWMSAEGLLEGVLRDFSSSGVTVSIDDFGTGFSSLSYIKKYSINKLKIAKELIDNITTSQTDKNIVMAIIALAKRLGVRTIAEGVEDEWQLEILRDLGCDEVQGYLWGKPMSQSDFEELIKEQGLAI